MAYKQFVPLTNPNFQFNRVYSAGPEGCREEELWEIASRLTQFQPEAWYREWHGLALRAEGEGRLMHAAWYHRMSEFFLPDVHPDKQNAYQAFRRCFYGAVDEAEFPRFEVPYEGTSLPALRLAGKGDKGVIIVFGGFDSFMEEFALELRSIRDRGYTCILFEGPGQGGVLRAGLKMTHEWEKPVAAVLDFFSVEKAALVGISLGGYLALRAAAFEPRIDRSVAYDIVYSMFDCITHQFPDSFRDRFRAMVKAGKKEEVNTLLTSLRAANDVIDWGLSHGMYVSGTENPYDYFRYWMQFTTEEISPLITGDVLLLAGENDHFIPLEMYDKQKEALVNARSVHGRIFTVRDGADQHCQVGNQALAWEEIIAWMEQ